MYASSMGRATARAAMLLALAAVTLCGGGGCQVPAAIMYKTMGPPPTPARYVPPKTPLLVLVENVHSGSSNVPEADELARVVYDDLKEHDVAPLVDPAKVHDLRDANPAVFAKMTIADVGRKLGARQILYVQVNQLNMDNPPGSDMIKVKIAARVKVVDVDSAHTVWPESADGEDYDYESRLERITPEMTRSGMNRQILRQGGTEIGRWFYPYQPENMREENKDLKLR